jgi:hypothetical protein
MQGLSSDSEEFSEEEEEIDESSVKEHEEGEVQEVRLESVLLAFATEEILADQTRRREKE